MSPTSEPNKEKNFKIIIYVTVAVLVIKYISVWFNLPEWLAESASDIFMAFLVALIALVLMRSEQLKEELNKHRGSWETGSSHLQTYGERLLEAKNELSKTRDDLKQLPATIEKTIYQIGGYLENTKTLYEASLKSINPNAYTTLQRQSTRLINEWANLLFLENNPQHMLREKSLRYLSSKCAELMYESYVEEEVEDIKNRALITTNYPTYLNFIGKLSTEFISDFTVSDYRAGLQDYKICFLAIANNLPIDWLMFCKYIEDGQWRCHIDDTGKLTSWANISSQLAKNKSVLFRRLFITSKKSGELSLPAKEVFDNLLDQFVWYPIGRQLPLQKGFPSSVESSFGQIGVNSSRHVKYDSNKEICFISPTASANSAIVTDMSSTQYTLNTPPMGLRNFLIDVVHGGNINCMKRLDVAEQKELFEGYDSELPLDMFIVGIIQSKATDLNDSFIPIMGIACLYNNFSQNVSVLRFFKTERFKEDEIKEWVLSLFKKAEVFK